MPIHSATPGRLYHEPAPRLPQNAFEFRAKHALLIALALAMLASASATPGARDALERWLPQTNGLFEAIGLPAYANGPSLGKIASNLDADSNPVVLTIEGEINNSQSRSVAVPNLRIALDGADGRELYHWTSPPPKKRLEAGESVTFRTRLEAPPPAARRVRLRFATADDAKFLPPLPTQ